MFVNVEVKHQDKAIHYLKTLSYFITSYVANKHINCFVCQCFMLFYNVSFQISFLFSLGTLGSFSINCLAGFPY